ncbi:MAG: galactokinase, partial [Pedosphaera parvula]|nr:galactokinase [Pedosphaera parvula]
RRELREQCEAAAAALRARSLRSVEPRYLSANRDKLTERQYQCAYHIVGENQRVVFGERALDEGDFLQFGQYLFQSHESSRDFFQNSCPELDLLVELAREHPACIGARLTGGGFGGATLSLIHLLRAVDFIDYMKAKYAEKAARQTAPFLCAIVDGAG